MPDFPRFVPVSDCGLLVEFGEEIGGPAHASVLALDRALAAAPVVGQCEIIPAYVNLMVVFDPLQTEHEAVAQAVRDRLDHSPRNRAKGRLHEIPVCYEGSDLARDLAQVAAETGLAPEDVIAHHQAGAYEVHLYGFAPGYAYMAGVPEPIRLPRKPAPVRGVPAGSVIVAGPQCIVTTLTMPTGWWVLGRSPARILTGDTSRPFLFDVGDRVRFVRIDRTEYDRLARDGT